MGGPQRVVGGDGMGGTPIEQGVENGEQRATRLGQHVALSDRTVLVLLPGDDPRCFQGLEARGDPVAWCAGPRHDVTESVRAERYFTHDEKGPSFADQLQRGGDRARSPGQGRERSDGHAVSLPGVSLDIKPKTTSLLPIAAGTALVLVTYVTPMATLAATATGLHADAGTQAWLLSSMSVGLAAGLLTAGVVGDNVGRRRVYLAGLLALALGGIGCFFAREPIGFIVGRVVEGLGGAAVLACGLATLAHDFPEARRRTHATAVWGTSVGVGITVGALLSAVLGAERWRESYLAVGAVALMLLWPSVSRVSETRAANRRRLDGAGLILFAAAMTLLVCALTLGRGGLRVAPVALGLGGLAALVAFAFVETRVRDPLIEPRLLRHSRFRAATIGSLTLGAGIISTIAFVPTLAQVGLRSGLWPASLLIVAWSGTSVATAYLSRHVRHPMQGPVPAALSLIVVAVGQGSGYGLDEQSSPWRLVPSLMLAGVATGLLNALLGREAVASVEADRAAMGSGANNTARYFGAAVGITLFVVIATHVGPNVVAGWNVAVLVSASITLLGAAGVALAGRSDRARVPSHDNVSRS